MLQISAITATGTTTATITGCTIQMMMTVGFVTTTLTIATEGAVVPRSSTSMGAISLPHPNHSRSPRITRPQHLHQHYMPMPHNPNLDHQGNAAHLAHPVAETKTAGITPRDKTVGQTVPSIPTPPISHPNHTQLEAQHSGTKVEEQSGDHLYRTPSLRDQISNSNHVYSSGIHY